MATELSETKGGSGQKGKLYQEESGGTWDSLITLEFVTRKVPSVLKQIREIENL